MKRYTIRVKWESGERSLDTEMLITAQNVRSAQNKAVRRARYMMQTKQITLANVESVTYEGFYLNRIFIPAQTLQEVLSRL